MTAFSLRAGNPNDAAAIADIVNQPGVRAGLSRLPYTSVADITEDMSSLDHNNRLIVADVKGRAVGYGRLARFQGRMAHVGEIWGVAVHDDFHHRGVGRALMEALIDLADNWLGLIRLELRVLTTNTTALKLYQSLGFEIEGRARALCLLDGEYADDYDMARLRPAPVRRAIDLEEAP